MLFDTPGDAHKAAVSAYAQLIDHGSARMTESNAALLGLQVRTGDVLGRAPSTASLYPLIRLTSCVHTHPGQALYQLACDPRRAFALHTLREEGKRDAAGEARLVQHRAQLLQQFLPHVLASLRAQPLSPAVQERGVVLLWSYVNSPGGPEHLHTVVEEVEALMAAAKACPQLPEHAPRTADFIVRCARARRLEGSESGAASA